MEERMQYRMDPRVFRDASSSDSSFFEKLTDSNSSTLLQVTVEKNTVLHVALQFKNFKAAESIVKLSPSLVLNKNSKDNTPLHVAVRVGDFSMVKLLIDEAKNLDVEANGRGQQKLLSMVNLDGDTALHIAVRYCNIEVVRELIKEGDPAKLAMQVNKAGESALFLAVDRQKYDIASHIQRNAPDCSYDGRHGMNVLHALAFRNWPEVGPRILLMRHLHLTEKSPRGFMRAVMGKCPSAIEIFMTAVMGKCPSAIEKGDNSGWTPLEIAAFIGNEKFVKLLLVVLEKNQKFINAYYSKNNEGFSENDQKFNIAYSKNKEGLSALHIAYSKDNEGSSALHIAAKEGKVEVMKELINKCPDIYELLDNMGRNALHVAAESGQSAAVNFFLDGPKFNGLINEQDREGNTPMHLAAIQEHFEIATQLLEHDKGVDLNSTNNDGLTTMDNLMLLGFRLTRELRMKLKDAQQSLRGVLLLKEMSDDSLNDPTMKAALADPEVPADQSISDSKADGMENSDTKADGMKNSISKADVVKNSDTKAEIMMDSDSKADGMKNSDTKVESMMDSYTKADGMKNSYSNADRTRNFKAVHKTNTNSKPVRVNNSDSNADSITKMAKNDMLVATLITTVTFTAAFTVPGGYRSQGVDEGKAVLSKTNAFHVFQIANTSAFGLSITSVFYNYARMTFKSVLQPSDHKQSGLAFTTYSIFLLLVAFVSGTYTVMPHSMGITTAVIVCCCFFNKLISSLPRLLAITCTDFIQSFPREGKQESDEELPLDDSKASPPVQG